MFIRKCQKIVNGKRYSYWLLLESYRTARGSRHRTVAYLGKIDASGRLGIKEAVEQKSFHQQSFFENEKQNEGYADTEIVATPPQDYNENEKTEWVEVDVNNVQIEKPRNFGDAWLAIECAQMLNLDKFFADNIPSGREEIPWHIMALVLVIMRLIEPSSELRIAEHLFERTALADILGVPADKVNDDRLYRALDKLLLEKAALETHLKERLGELFELDYDILLYDITSTYFEGSADKNPLAQRGYSRDNRGDCKQVTIALVVDKNGIPLAHEVFAGNRHDSTTVEEIVELIESRYGRANRVWVMDRGMVSAGNIDFLKSDGRRYILGTPKNMLRNFERELLSGGWNEVREGLEVKLCASPDGDETFILCRSADRREKEEAMRKRFEERIEKGLEKIALGCSKRRQKASDINRRVGRLLAENSRAARLFSIDVNEKSDGFVDISWSKLEKWRDWATLSEGCYLLRSNIMDWGAEELWKAYIHLTEAEAAFRVNKSDLSIRPVWHQREDRVRAHIFVCFLSYVLWKSLGQFCKRAGLGDEPRRVLDELGGIQLVDVILHTRCGRKIRRRCISRPTEHQSILLGHLGLVLPKLTKYFKM